MATEMELLDAFVDAVRSLDPDMLVGYDVRKVLTVLCSQHPQCKVSCWLCFCAR